MAAVARKRPKADLVQAMNEQAKALLEASKADTVSLETKLATFSQVGRWIAISNRVADADDEQIGLLDAYRERITSTQSEVAEREADRIKAFEYERGPGYAKPGTRSYRNGPEYKAGAARHRNRIGGDNGGSQLDALKARLPKPDDSSADGDRRGGGGEIAIDAGPVRVVRPQLPGDTDREHDEPYSSDEF